MASIKYEIKIKGDGVINLENGNATLAVISGIDGDTPPANAHVLSASVEIKNFYCRSKKQPYFFINSSPSTGSYYGYTGGLSYGGST